MKGVQDYDGSQFYHGFTMQKEKFFLSDFLAITKLSIKRGFLSIQSDSIHLTTRGGGRVW